MEFVCRFIGNYASIKLGEFVCFVFLIILIVLLKIEIPNQIITFASVWALVTSFVGYIFSVIFKSAYNDDGTGVQLTCTLTLLILPLLQVISILNLSI